MTIYVLCGPPGAGKTTIVNKYLNLGDLVIDLDALGQAITGQDLQGYLFETPRSILDVLLPLKSHLIELAINYHAERFCKNVWITISGARASDRKRLSDLLCTHPHKIFVFEISHNVCREHIKNDPSRGSWQLWDPIIKKWWNDYMPLNGDIVVSTTDLDNFSITP